MAGMDWFRWHHGSVNDPKFQLVAKRAGASVAEVVAVWACLLEAASSADDRGNVGTPDFEAIDCAMGLEDGKTGAIYAAMAARNLVGDDGSIMRWSSRQPKRERDDGATWQGRAFRGHGGGVAADAATKSQTQPIAAKRSHAPPSAAKKSPEESRGEKRREIQGESACERGRDSPPPHPPDGGPPPISDEFRDFVASERPELDAGAVYQNFVEHYPPAKRTLARWHKWVRSEIVPRVLPRDSPHAQVADPDSRASVEARGVACGLGRWNEVAEQWGVYKSRVNGVPA